MRIDNMIRMWLRALFRRNRVEEDLDEELRYHVERDIEENIREGMTPEEARLQAIRSLEGIERRKEECRDARGTRWLERLAAAGWISIWALRAHVQALANGGCPAAVDRLRQCGQFAPGVALQVSVLPHVKI